MLGAIAFTRKLSFEYVAADDLTNPSMPDLAALITSWLDNPSYSATEEKNKAEPFFIRLANVLKR